MDEVGENITRPPRPAPLVVFLELTELFLTFGEVFCREPFVVGRFSTTPADEILRAFEVSRAQEGIKRSVFLLLRLRKGEGEREERSRHLLKYLSTLAGLNLEMPRWASVLK